MLLFLDVGGSMDPHVQVCEELFSAAKSEFRHLEYFYFHNCVYDHVWRDNFRRKNERFGTLELIRTYGPDWRVIFVGDAAMGPYELTQIDGSVEYRNLEPGLKWLGRIFTHFRKVIWWNPEPARGWEYYGYAMDAVGHDYVSALTHAGSCPQCFYVFPPIWEAAPAYF